MMVPESLFGSLLVVEDDADACRMLVDTLTLAGFEVRSASHGAEALRLLDRHTPNLVLLDLVLPWVNGLEVLTTLRENPAFRRMPVIVTTGTFTTDFDLKAFQPVRVFRKPLNFDALMLTIRQLLAESSTPGAET